MFSVSPMKKKAKKLWKKIIPPKLSIFDTIQPKLEPEDMDNAYLDLLDIGDSKVA